MKKTLILIGVNVWPVRVYLVQQSRAQFTDWSSTMNSHREWNVHTSIKQNYRFSLSLLFLSFLNSQAKVKIERERKEKKVCSQVLCLVFIVSVCWVDWKPLWLFWEKRLTCFWNCSLVDTWIRHDHSLTSISTVSPSQQHSTIKFIF